MVFGEQLNWPKPFATGAQQKGEHPCPNPKVRYSGGLIGEACEGFVLADEDHDFEDAG